MITGRGPQTASGFHVIYSVCVGGGVPVYVRENNGAALIILLGLWVGLQLFMYARGRSARGVFIDEKFGEFALIGAGGFSIGLLFISTVLVVVGK
jgi:hypothetical protein